MVSLSSVTFNKIAGITMKYTNVVNMYSENSPVETAIVAQVRQDNGQYAIGLARVLPNNEIDNLMTVEESAALVDIPLDKIPTVGRTLFGPFNQVQAEKFIDIVAETSKVLHFQHRAAAQANFLINSLPNRDTPAFVSSGPPQS